MENLLRLNGMDFDGDYSPRELPNISKSDGGLSVQGRKNYEEILTKLTGYAVDSITSNTFINS